MTEVKTEAEVGASADEVWKLVSDFGGFVEAFGLPVTTEGAPGVGQTRTITMGEPTVERCEALDVDARAIAYSVVSGPLPVRDYLGTMQVHEAGAGRSRITWDARFEPEGMSEEDAAKVIQGIFDGGLAALQGRFGS
jgi:hypothetical protein